MTSGLFYERSFFSMIFFIYFVRYSNRGLAALVVQQNIKQPRHKSMFKTSGLLSPGVSFFYRHSLIQHLRRFADSLPLSLA